MTSPNCTLTPEQAADVIRYYYRGENAKSIERHWKPKVSLGKAAMHAASRHETILPSGEPLLTMKEQGEGLAYILEKPALPEPTAEEWKRIDELTEIMNAYEAYASVMGVWPNT